MCDWNVGTEHKQAEQVTGTVKIMHFTYSQGCVNVNTSHWIVYIPEWQPYSKEVLFPMQFTMFFFIPCYIGIKPPQCKYNIIFAHNKQKYKTLSLPLWNELNDSIQRKFGVGGLVWLTYQKNPRNQIQLWTNDRRKNLLLEVITSYWLMTFLWSNKLLSSFIQQLHSMDFVLCCVSCVLFVVPVLHKLCCVASLARHKA